MATITMLTWVALPLGAAFLTSFSAFLKKACTGATRGACVGWMGVLRLRLWPRKELVCIRAAIVMRWQFQ